MGLSNFRAPEPTDEQRRAAELKAAGLMRDSFNGRVRPIPTEPTPTAAEVDAGWAAIREQARINTAAAERAAADERTAAAAEVAAVAADKQAAWLRYQALAGRNADGGLVADFGLFNAEWARHLAQRAILESAGPVDG